MKFNEDKINPWIFNLKLRLTIMSHKHDTHFIPSPFKVVTQYENAFVRAWNNNIAEAVAEVLKYIANATAVAIKQVK